MTFLVVVGYVQETTDGDYARRIGWWWVRPVRANFIV
jgi:hypothetical protein